MQFAVRSINWDFLEEEKGRPSNSSVSGSPGGHVVCQFCPKAPHYLHASIHRAVAIVWEERELAVNRGNRH